MKPKSVVALASCLAISFFAMPLACFAEGQPAKPPTKSASSSYRLPKTVLPDLYDLEFTPNLRDFTFLGTAAIDVSTKEKTDTIVLNAIDLKITDAKLTRIKTVGESPRLPAKAEAESGSVTVDAEHEQVRITFKTPLEKNSLYRLHLEFTGELNDKLRGFYRSHYLDDKGEKKWLATTQMEPTDARRMFPCFDEPEMKAKFKITAHVNEGSIALSNGKASKPAKGYADALAAPGELRETITFEPSPKMSSYLVALIIGNFKPGETKEVNGIPVTVWALAGKEHLGKYALDAACDILKYQHEYFGIPYPHNKLDLIAIPDFRSGAMENLGAITFREANLLVDEKTGSNSAKRTVFAIVAHEIAHQWFGDLVTMRWWNDIWLNEAFASWMGTKTVDAIHPEWQELTKAILTRNGSMLVDELQATRAIHSDVSDPKQAAEMFDSITYDKGESILWMLESYVGEKKFQQGIHDYLSAHEFGNATSEDLWESIGKASALPVSGLMKSWVFQPGFPILNTTSGGSSLDLTQKRFFGMPGVEADNSLWQVPLVVRELKPFDTSGKTLTRLMVGKSESITLPKDWSGALVNAGGRGFYRTQYPTETQQEILKHFDYLSPEERLAFLSDISALTWKGNLPVQDKLSVLFKLTDEKNPIVQEKLMDFCWHPYVYLDSAHHNDYEKLMRSVVGPVKDNLGWKETPGEEDNIKDLRRSVINLLGTFGQDAETIAEARELYKQYMADRQSVSPDVASAVLTVTTYNGGEKEYEEIIAALKTEKIPELEKRFLSSLTHFAQPELVDKTLNMVLSDTVRSQDGFRVLAGMLDGHRTKHRTWAFVKEHWTDITKKFPPRSMANLAYACAAFDKPDEEEDLRSFFAAHELPYAKAAVARMLEEVHRRVLYRQKNEQAIRIWVTEQAAKATNTTN
ncbi:M1 family metallopeptidase [Candidatus Obscuribacterales bacterium]|nr:M1 family metallopeptidase [Candidatus Obscuribacterales bacterium]